MDLCPVTFRSFVVQWLAKIVGCRPQLKPLIKLKLPISNKKMLLSYKIHTVMFFGFFLGQQGSRGKLCKIITLNL